MILTKDLKHFYTENYKTEMKEIKADTNKWKNITFLWIEIMSLKMSTLSKVIYIFNAVLIKSQ